MPLVLVTGLNGFVAVHTAVQFLQRGWAVRGTVRTEAKAKTTKVLGAFKGWENKLEVVVVEDLTEEDLSPFLEGVDAVAHVAAPHQFNLKTWKEYHDGAVQATKHVLAQAAKFESIKSCVLLSSFVTVNESPRPYKQFKGKVYNENDVYPITEEECSSLNVDDKGTGAVWYCASKKFQEDAANDYVRENKTPYSLAVLCPSFVLGAPLEVDTVEDLRNAPGVATGFLQSLLLVEGKEAPFDAYPSWVDPRDVGTAIVEAATRRAKGRYIIAGGLCDSIHILRSAVKSHPELKDKVAKDGPSPLDRDGSFTVDNSKSIRNLGLKYHTLDEMVSDTIERYKTIGAA